jgi:hypothetical protein
VDEGRNRDYYRIRTRRSVAFGCWEMNWVLDLKFFQVLGESMVALTAIWNTLFILVFMQYIPIAN